MRNVFVANCCEMGARTKRHRWPLIVQVGSIRIPIYRDQYEKRIGKRPRIYERYILAYYQSDGEIRTRRLRSFSSVEDARFEAQRIATAIADGEADVLKLKSADRASYLHAIRELKPFGVPLHIAISEYVAARKHAGAGLITAAKDYAQRHAFVTARKTLRKLWRSYSTPRSRTE